MKTTFFAVVCAVLLVACGEFVSSDAAVRAAVSSGIVDPRITGQHGIAPGFYGCGEDDDVAFDVAGRNASGQPVNAVVCCGLVFKNCTVRWK